MIAAGQCFSTKATKDEFLSQRKFSIPSIAARGLMCVNCVTFVAFFFSTFFEQKGRVVFQRCLGIAKQT